MIIAVLIWIDCGISAGVIASGRGESGCLWFALGFLFGPFALDLRLYARIALPVLPKEDQ